MGCLWTPVIYVRDTIVSAVGMYPRAVGYLTRLLHDADDAGVACVSVIAPQREAVGHYCAPRMPRHR